MDSLEPNDVRKLLENKSAPSISIYMPTDPTGATGEQDLLRLKNLVVGAEKRLTDDGMRGPDAAKFVAPLRGLLTEPVFWENCNRGLAVFLAPGTFRALRLPLAFDESLSCGERFYVRPLLPLLDGNGTYFLLAISQNQVRLLEGNRDEIVQLDVAGLPKDKDGALNYDVAEKVGQAHTGSAGRGKQAAVFHGQGAKADAHKDDLEKYCRIIDAAVARHLRDSAAPLILAGVDYLLPIYRRANSYAGLLDDAVVGSPDQLKPKQLHAKAWAIAEEHLNAQRLAALQRYDRLAATEKASHDVAQIIVAAREGKVDVLLIAAEGQCWGAFDADSGELQMHAQQLPGDDDLLELAASQTLLQGGKVHVVRADQMPDQRLAVAVFRY